MEGLNDLINDGVETTIREELENLSKRFPQMQSILFLATCVDDEGMTVAFHSRTGNLSACTQSARDYVLYEDERTRFRARKDEDDG